MSHKHKPIILECKRVSYQTSDRSGSLKWPDLSEMANCIQKSTRKLCDNRVAIATHFNKYLISEVSVTTLTSYVTLVVNRSMGKFLFLTPQELKPKL